MIDLDGIKQESWDVSECEYITRLFGDDAE
jgi:hypothetical protein